MGPCEDRNQKQIYFCAVCGGPGSSRHHLIPQAIRKRRPGIANSDTIRLCPECHGDVHYCFSLYELAFQFNNEELLKTELAKRKAWPLRH